MDCSEGKSSGDSVILKLDRREKRVRYDRVMEKRSKLNGRGQEDAAFCIRRRLHALAYVVADLWVAASASNLDPNCILMAVVRGRAAMQQYSRGGALGVAEEAHEDKSGYSTGDETRIVCGMSPEIC